MKENCLSFSEYIMHEIPKEFLFSSLNLYYLDWLLWRNNINRNSIILILFSITPFLIYLYFLRFELLMVNKNLKYSKYIILKIKEDHVY